MGALLLFNLKHIVRTKLLIFLFLFSFLVQFVSLRLLNAMTVSVQGLVSIIGPQQTLFASLIFQLFTGAFLSAVYGIWMVPYCHQGQRGQLTFTLPISKWMHPAVYALSMLCLLLLQHGLMLLSFGLLYGFGAFLEPSFPWRDLGLCLALETLAFEACMFAFALGSMILGQIPTFFVGALSIFLLQASAAIFRLDFTKFMPTEPAPMAFWRVVYHKLPPMGELVFDLKECFLRNGSATTSFVLWAIWLVALVLLFRWKIRFPSQSRSTES